MEINLAGIRLRYGLSYLQRARAAIDAEFDPCLLLAMRRVREECARGASVLDTLIIVTAMLDGQDDANAAASAGLLPAIPSHSSSGLPYDPANPPPPFS